MRQLVRSTALALDELAADRADMVLTGGVDADNSAFMYLCFSKTPAFSRSNRIRPFDADSDGMLVGEGLGMLVLKRLADAERDGDRVYAVIRGLGASSDGRYKSIYAPRSEGQARALRRAYEEAGVAPASIGLVEAHGTGTSPAISASSRRCAACWTRRGEDAQPHIALGQRQVPDRPHEGGGRRRRPDQDGARPPPQGAAADDQRRAAESGARGSTARRSTSTAPSPALDAPLRRRAAARRRERFGFGGHELPRRARGART